MSPSRSMVDFSTQKVHSPRHASSTKKLQEYSSKQTSSTSSSSPAKNRETSSRRSSSNRTNSTAVDHDTSGDDDKMLDECIKVGIARTLQGAALFPVTTTVSFFSHFSYGQKIISKINTILKFYDQNSKSD